MDLENSLFMKKMIVLGNMGLVTTLLPIIISGASPAGETPITPFSLPEEEIHCQTVLGRMRMDKKRRQKRTK